MSKNDKINAICDKYNISKIWKGKSKYIIFDKECAQFDIDLHGVNKYNDLEFLILNRIGAV